MLALDFTGYPGLLKKLVTRRGLSSIVHARQIQVVAAQLWDVSVFFVSRSIGQPYSSHRLRISLPSHRLFLAKMPFGAKRFKSIIFKTMKSGPTNKTTRM